MNKNIEVTAHRGCKGTLPENTLISFEKAVSMKPDYIEYDVHMTLDGVLVIMHDSLVERTTGASGALDFMTYDEVKRLDAGETLYGEKFKGTPVPTLRETLSVVASADYPLRQIVEIKDFRAVVADKIVEMLDEFGLTERSIIECGDAQVLLYLHKKYPEIKLLTFAKPHMIRYDPKILDFVYGMAISIGSTKLGDENQMTELVTEMKNRGIKSFLFNGDNPELTDKCLRIGADNITSNYPDFCLEYLKSKGLHE